MKKLSAFLLLIVISMCLVVPSFASDGNTNDVSIVYDNQRLPYKELNPQVIERLTTRATGPSNPRWVANCELTRATSDSYWDSKKTTRWAIDEISAYFRAYNGNSLDYSTIDSQTNASHAAAGYDHVWATERIGQHYFAQTGYQGCCPYACDLFGAEDRF